MLRKELDNLKSELALDARKTITRGYFKTESALAETADLISRKAFNACFDKLWPEIDRLKRVIARELNENDELGSEYTYVQCLKDTIREMKSNQSNINVDSSYYIDILKNNLCQLEASQKLRVKDQPSISE